MFNDSTFYNVLFYTGLIFVEDLSKREFYSEKTHTFTFMDAVKDGIKVIMKHRPYHGRAFIISLLVVCTIAQCYQIGTPFVVDFISHLSIRFTDLYNIMFNYFRWNDNDVLVLAKQIRLGGIAVWTFHVLHTDLKSYR